MTDLPAATPFLALDLAVLEANIARTQRWADERGVLLRPHVKTHKSVEIARRQVDAGAHGITVATVGEAEVFVAAGFDDVFLAYPVWATDALRDRLSELTRTATVRVGFDSVEGAGRLVGLGVRGVVEVDSGHHRTGVRPGEAGGLAADAVRAGLEVDGVFTFPGHSYARHGHLQAGLDESLALDAAAGSLRSAGVEPTVISGGSTPSLAATGPTLTETRPGVYVVNDAQQWELRICPPTHVALSCHATVVSRAGGRVVLNAGSKVLGADRAGYATGFGRLLDHPEARIVQLSEHHAVAEVPGDSPDLGSVVRVVPNHACNAANLADEFIVFSGGVVADRWRVDARGRND